MGKVFKITINKSISTLKPLHKEEKNQKKKLRLLSLTKEERFASRVDLAKFLGVKNPEYRINGKLADLKTQSGARPTSNIKRAILQGVTIIVFKINKQYPFNDKRLLQQIKGDLKRRGNTAIDTIYIINKENKLGIYKV